MLNYNLDSSGTERGTTEGGSKVLVLCVYVSAFAALEFLPHQVTSPTRTSTVSLLTEYSYSFQPERLSAARRMIRAISPP